MKHYFKIDNDTIIEALKTIVKDNYTIYGYNNESNEKMLIDDGYRAFPKPAYCYKIVNGEIVQKEQQIIQKNIFTKLQIRRACRELNLEDKLNTLIEADEKYKTDWQDAQQINLDDDMFKQAIQSGIFTDFEIQSIKDYLK